jgi:TonB family protein
MAGVRCESCGGPTDGDSLCSTCHRVFHRILERDPASAAPPAKDETTGVVATPRPVPLPPIAPLPPLAEIHAAPSRRAEAVRPSPRTPRSPALTAAPPIKPRLMMPAWRFDARGASLAVSAAAAIGVAAAVVPVAQEWFSRQPFAMTAATAPTSVAGVASAMPAPPTSPDRRSEARRRDSGENTTASPKTNARARGTNAAERTPTSTSAPARRPASSPRSTKSPRPAKKAQAPPALVPEAVVELPSAPAFAAPAAPIAPAPRAAEPIAEPAAPFYEIAQVGEKPRVVSQVELQLSGELRARATGEVVVLRVLVSHTGQPAAVTVLRKSKGGADLDRAAIAAVKQWRFAPARRRGEPVSCWFNVGVPLGAD